MSANLANTSFRALVLELALSLLILLMKARVSLPTWPPSESNTGAKELTIGPYSRKNGEATGMARGRCGMIGTSAFWCGWEVWIVAAVRRDSAVYVDNVGRAVAGRVGVGWISMNDAWPT